MDAALTLAKGNRNENLVLRAIKWADKTCRKWINTYS